MKNRFIGYVILQLFILQLTTLFPQGNWPQMIYGEPYVWIGMVSPVITDLDNDGIKELVVTTQGNSQGHLSTLYIFEADGGIRAQVDVDYYFDPTEFPSIADIDNDDEMEIIMECTGPSDNQILIFDSQGNLEQNFAIEFQMSDDLFGSTVLADVNQDSTLEIIYGGWYLDGARLVVLDNNGNNMPGFPVLLEENNGLCQTNTPAVGNLDDDDDWEIVTISHKNNTPPDTTNIRAYNIDGSLLWVQKIGSISNCDPVIGDVNNDGFNEVIFNSEDGVYILDKNGNFLLNLTLGQGMDHSDIALADLDSHNDLELIFEYGFSLYAIHDDGTIMFTNSSAWITVNPPVAGDINNDGLPDIVINSEDSVYALNYNGVVLEGFPKPMRPISWYTYPAIDDIDNDGKVDVVSSSNWIDTVPDSAIGIIYVWELNNDYQQSTMQWQMYQHDPQHTGNYLGGNIVPVELVSFTAEFINKEVLLKWTTATETNNQGFEVERKVSSGQTSASNWEKIINIAGYGTTTEPKSYSFTDENVTNGRYTYRLKQMDFDGTFEYSREVDVDVSVPYQFALGQNYPNPFNPVTIIKYSIPQSSNVIIKIFGILGNEIETLVNEEKPAGNYELNWNAANLPSGAYFYQLKAGNFIQTKKMILLK